MRYRCGPAMSLAFITTFPTPPFPPRPLSVVAVLPAFLHITKSKSGSGTIIGGLVSLNTAASVRTQFSQCYNCMWKSNGNAFGCIMDMLRDDE